MLPGTMDTEHLNAALLGPASLLAAVQQVRGAAIREQSMSNFGRMIEAHLLATGLISSTLTAVQGKLKSFDAKEAHREALVASFVVGESLCHDGIMRGQYLQASALVRQELETLAALREIAGGRRKDGLPPQVSVLEPSMRRLYGGLSDAAHVGREWVVTQATRAIAPWVDMPAETAITRHYPEFDETTGRRLFALHIFLMLNMAAELANDAVDAHGMSVSEVQREGFDAVLDLLVAEGMMEYVNPPP